MKYLIFDFNGTIVNDIALSLESFNYCLNKYLNKGPLSLEEYRNIFCFPVIDYYKKVGFDFNVQSWEEVAKCWMDHYQKHHHECEIFDGVTDLIIEAHKLGYRCVVLSASETSILNFQLKEFGIFDYFDDVIGIDDIYAVSKVEYAKKYFDGKDLSDSLLLGDTDHDKQVADELGCKCILIASGHQAYDKLIKCNDIVYNSIKEVKL